MKKLVYGLFFLHLILGCNTDISRRDVTVLLDMIPFCDRIHFLLNIRKGMDISSIMELYGEPRYLFFKDAEDRIILKDNASGELTIIARNMRENTYRIQVKGYDPAKFPITNMIYVYLGGFDAIAYVYVDSQYKVENIDVGGS